MDEKTEPTAIVGKVQDVASNPITGATIQLLNLPFRRNISRKGRIYMDDSFGEEIIQHTVTDEDGTFEFKELVPNTKLYMRALHPEFVSQFKDSVAVGLIVDFRLERGTRVEGVVSDKDSGEPVEGATLTLTEGNYTETLTEGNRGHYIGAGERAGTYTLTVEAEGFVTQTLEDLTIDADVCHVIPITQDVTLTPS